MKISKLKLIIAILFTKNFLNGFAGLSGVIEYAVKHHRKFRGEGSSDVLSFICKGYLNKITKPNK